MTEPGFRVPLPTLLRRVEIFQDLGDEERAALASRMELRRILSGEPVFREGDPSDGLYVVHTGEVGVVAESGEGRRVLARLGPGECFGEMSLLTGEPRSTSVYATLDSEMLFLRDAAFQIVVMRWPAVALALGRTLSLRLRRANLAAQAPSVDRIILLVSSTPRLAAREAAARLAASLAACRSRPALVLDLDAAGADGGASGAIERLGRALRGGEDLDLAAVLPQTGPSVRTLVLGAAGRDWDRRMLGRLLGIAVAQFGAAVLAAEAPGPERAGGAFEEALRQCDAAVLVVDAHEPSLGRGRELLEHPAGARDAAEDAWRVALIRPARVAPGTVREVESRLGAPVSFHLVEEDSRGYDRLARRLGRAAVGLALGGGGARGLAHIGILEVLAEEGIPIDVIGGTSIGAILAALHALGHAPARIAEIFRREWVERNPLSDYTFPRSALIRGRRGERVLRRVMGEIEIEDLTAPFFAVAADLVSADEVLLARGPLWLAVRASGSIPVLLLPVRAGRRFLVDGGIINNVPGDHLARFGADVSIAVDVTPRREAYFERLLDRPARTGALGRLARRSALVREWLDYPGIVRTLRRIVAIEGIEIMKTKSAAFDVCIRPEVEGFDLLDFARMDSLIDAGREAASRALPGIRRRIEEASGRSGGAGEG